MKALQILIRFVRLTGETTFKKPGDEEIFEPQEEGEEWFWLPDQKYAWIPAKFIQTEDDIDHFEGVNEDALTYPHSKSSDIIPFKKHLLKYYTHVNQQL